MSQTLKTKTGTKKPKNTKQHSPEFYTKWEMATVEQSRKDGDTLDEDMQTSLAKRYNKERKGVHVSDIEGTCVRMQVFRKLEPIPLNQKEISNFVTGEGMHFAQEELSTGFDKYTAEKDNLITHKNIVATPDLINNESEIVYELKTLRKGEIQEPYEHQIDQLRAYLALTGKDVGYIKYLLLNYRPPYGSDKSEKMQIEETPFVKFRVPLKNGEGKKILEALELKAAAYAMALVHKNPELAPHIAYDPRFIDTYGNWLCRYCNYSEKCTEMRSREREGVFQK